MKIAFVLLASLEFLTGAIGLPKLDYNQFANTAKSLEKKLQPNGMSDVMGCCPTIVKENSEISSSGCEVQVKIVVNISPSGKESTVQAAMQNCTSEDHKFIWTVDWGDGAKDIGHQWSIGGYGINHALPCTKPATYGVTANYCSDPDDTAEHRCCDSIFRSIYVP